MHDQQTLRRRLPRLVLLFAGLLYLLGAAADPIVHAYAAADAPAAELAAGGADADRETPESEPTHDERHCLLCKVAGVGALASPTPVVPVPDVRPHSTTAIGDGGPRAPPAHLTSQPRAPPHA
jgi:hypothetical protein